MHSYFDTPFDEHVIERYTQEREGNTDMLSCIEIPLDEHVTALYTQGRENDRNPYGITDIKDFFDIADEFQLDFRRFFQVYLRLQADVCIVDSEMAGDGVVRKESGYADAAVTDEADIPLCMTISDCPPVYLYDPKHHVIGLVHSGRQGTALNIVGKTIGVMHQRFQCDPSDIMAAIGPHICEKCYEVGEDVALAFELVFPEAVRSGVVNRQHGKTTINLDAAISHQLIAAGIQSDNLTHMKECTYENPLMFSYRRGDGKRSDLAVMALRSK